MPSRRPALDRGGDRHDARVSQAELRIGYGPTVDGPTLRLVATRRGIAQLQAVFRRLEAGKGPIWLGGDVGSDTAVELDGVDVVELRQGRDHGLRRIRGRRPGFVWAGDAERWRTRAELLDPLARHREPLRQDDHVFQYLDDDEVGDATVVVELRE
jgi:hypothetical protein